MIDPQLRPAIFIQDESYGYTYRAGISLSGRLHEANWVENRSRLRSSWWCMEGDREHTVISDKTWTDYVDASWPDDRRVHLLPIMADQPLRDRPSFVYGLVLQKLQNELALTFRPGIRIGRNDFRRVGIFEFASPQRALLNLFNNEERTITIH